VVSLKYKADHRNIGADYKESDFNFANFNFYANFNFNFNANLNVNANFNVNADFNVNANYNVYANFNVNANFNENFNVIVPISSWLKSYIRGPKNSTYPELIHVYIGT
jgi:hypothetical protein